MPLNRSRARDKIRLLCVYYHSLLAKAPGNKRWFHLDGIFLGICEQKAINSWGSRSISNQSESLTS